MLRLLAVTLLTQLAKKDCGYWYQRDHSPHRPEKPDSGKDEYTF